MVSLLSILSPTEENLLLVWCCFSYSPNRQQTEATYRLIYPVQIGTERKEGKRKQKREITLLELISSLLSKKYFLSQFWPGPKIIHGVLRSIFFYIQK